ncbi:MAG TPA: 3-deoxy-D-manno-octulosonic acid transferase [Terriglobia bacterium]|nr:3-deoxy-D-manno-octulosonic acid transferase [Terriglobia bacterium]
MYLLYSLLFTIGVLLTSPYYLWRMRARSGGLKGTAGWRERFGLLPTGLGQSRESGNLGPDSSVPTPDSRLPTSDSGSIWVHAVSVGETLAVIPLVKELQRLYPERNIFLSHVTPAGRQASESKLPGVTGRFYLPLDWRWAVDRAVARVRPSLLVIVETELWPNLLRSAHQSGARVALVNARLSERSYRGYRLARPFMKRVLDNIDWIGAQSDADAERFRGLGAAPERVEVTGNVKFDVSRVGSRESGVGKEDQLSRFLNLQSRAPGPDSRFPTLVAASTMPGEESLLLPVWSEIRQKYPRALMILAPRHPARFDQVAQFLSAQGRSFVRRTALDNGHSREEPPPAQAGGGNPPPGNPLESEILLLDTIGELAGVFAFADLVFVAGSLVPTGGHNLLEPAFWAKPVIFGPHMENFRDVSSLFLSAGAAVQVNSAAELGKVALELLADPPRRERLGKAARELLDQQAGATARILGRLRNLAIL